MESPTALPHYDQFPIPPAVPAGWVPQCIRCMSLSISIDTSGTLQFNYAKVGDFDPDCLDEAVKAAQAFDVSETADEPSVDLSLAIPLLMVLQLPKSLNMQYAPDGDAVTLKEQITKGAYGKLMHLKADGSFTPDPPGEGCKLAYFAAQPPHMDPLIFEDGFNINVQLLQVQKNVEQQLFIRHLPLLIDPDIKHPGGTGGG